MVTAAARAWAIAAAIPDPEVPVLTIEDLGVLRDVAVDGSRVTVTITPTYSGCPAVDAIRDDVVLALTMPGFDDVDVRLTLAPAWTTDWMSEAGKTQAARLRHRTAERARVGRRSDPAAAGRQVPALRVARHPRSRPLRLDLVQGPLRVPRVPRALRPLQGALMAVPPSVPSGATSRPVGALRQAAGDHRNRAHRRRAAGERGRRPVCARAQARPIPRAPGDRGATAHRGGRRGDVRDPRATCRASSTISPGSTSRFAPTSTDTRCGARIRCAGRPRPARSAWRSSATWAAGSRPGRRASFAPATRST